MKTRLSSMAEAALLDRCTKTNPRVPTKEDIIKILKRFGKINHFKIKKGTSQARSFLFLCFFYSYLVHNYHNDQKH